MNDHIWKPLHYGTKPGHFETSNHTLFYKRGSERSERAIKRVSAAEGASKASSPERANERTDEQVAQYFSLYSWLFLTIVRELVGNGDLPGERKPSALAELHYLGFLCSASMASSHDPFVFAVDSSLDLVPCEFRDSAKKPWL